MNKISIIKKIQLGENNFSLDHFFDKVNFRFYCANGEIKHHAILSSETSNLLDDLIETKQIDQEDLIHNNSDLFKKTGLQKNPFSYRYQIYNSQDCNNTYLIIFDISEYRDYFSCHVNTIFQIESKNSITDFQPN